MGIYFIKGQAKRLAFSFFVLPMNGNKLGTGE
jgi:hypothetical protein